MSRPFAIVTGASSGIGLELAAICAQEGFDLLVAADRTEIHPAADRCRALGAEVTVVEADLATTGALIASGQPLPVVPSMRCWRMQGTASFERADMLDTKIGQGRKDAPADVARIGFDAMMRGDGDVVSGWQNKLQSAIANITLAGILAEAHRRMAAPLLRKARSSHRWRPRARWTSGAARAARP